MNPISDIESLNSIIKDYSSKNSISNIYVFNQGFTQYVTNENLFSLTNNHNAYILAKNDDFFKLYYILNNKNELLNYDFKLPVILEIIYQGALHRPLEIISYWERCSFGQYLTRDLFTATYDQLNTGKQAALNIQIKFADTEKEILYTQKLIESTFDKYTGDVMTYQEVKTCAENNEIICAYFKGNISGVLRIEKKHNIIWLGHVAVAPEFRGNGIADALLDVFIEKNKANSQTRYHLWVIQDNLKAIALYRKFGFSFSNKSVVSMIRR